MSGRRPTIAEVTEALEEVAPLSIQESYDNCGLLVGDPGKECSGVLLTVDVTPRIVDEAAETGCNLIVAHHPIIFSGLKRLQDHGTAVEQAVVKAIRQGISIYACHTSMDSAIGGVSYEMASKLGLSDVTPLCPRTDNPRQGLGATGRLTPSLTGRQLIERVKQTFGSPIVRHTIYDLDKEINCVALCGGSGASMINDAIATGAEAFITSDSKYHTFVDFADRILLIDIGHHESENCTKEIFYRIITEKFPIFAVRYSEFDNNPIKYL